MSPQREGKHGIYNINIVPGLGQELFDDTMR